MNIEELQDLQDLLGRPMAYPTWMEPIVEAARLVANPNIEAAVTYMEDWEDSDQWTSMSYKKAIAGAVAAALDPQGATE